MTTEIVPIVPAVLGNTSDSRQISPSKNWCFTLHNYTEEDIKDIISTCSSISRFTIFSKELGKSGETPHLQGYTEFRDKIRPKTSFTERISWRKASGKKHHNIDYIKKERGDYYLNGKLVKKLRVLRVEDLYEWQRKIYDLVLKEPDDRSIIWVYGEEGNNGKSAFCKFLCAKHNALILAGKAADMKYGVIKYIEKHTVAPEIIIIDSPRSQENHISYGAIEEIKNGCFFSNKYESDMVLFNSPHIVVMSNFECPEDKFSEDRLLKITV